MGKVRILLMPFKHRGSAMLNAGKNSFLSQRIGVVFLLLATEKDLPVTEDQSEVADPFIALCVLRVFLVFQVLRTLSVFPTQSSSRTGCRGHLRALCHELIKGTLAKCKAAVSLLENSGLE